MKKLFSILILAICLPAVALGDGRHHERHRDEGGRNPWPFIAGAVLGGVIVNEYSRGNRYEEPRPARRIQLCEDFISYDVYNRPIVERRCHYEWVSDY